MPAGGAADGEAALFESLESETETGVVDAQALAQDGPGERLAGATERGAHCLGERGRWGAAALSTISESGWSPPPERRSRRGSGAGAERCSTVSCRRSSGRRTR